MQRIGDDLQITLEKRKHNQHGPAEVVWVRQSSDPMFDVPSLMTRYLRVTHIDKYPGRGRGQAEWSAAERSVVGFLGV